MLKFIVLLEKPLRVVVVATFYNLNFNFWDKKKLYSMLRCIMIYFDPDRGISEFLQT